MHKHSVWIAALVVAACMSLGLAQQAADTILYNGKILTVDSNFSTAQAVAVRGTQIAAVGTDDEVLRLAGSNTVTIDLKGKTVTPGLIHTHVHLESLGGYLSEIPLSRRTEFPLNFRIVNSKDDVIQQIQDIIAAAKIPAGRWLYFPSNPQGPHHARLIFDELNASDLDKAAPNNPIIVGVGMPKTNIHMASGKAMELVRRKYGNFLEHYGRYWIDATGKPSGIVEAPSSQIIWEDDEFALFPAPEDAGPLYRKLLEENFSSLGVTTISGGMNTAVIRAYQWLDSQGELPVRYGYGAKAAFSPGADLNRFQLGAGTDNVWITSVTARAVDGAGGRMCISLTRDSKAVGAIEGAGNSVMGLSAAADWWPRGQCNLDIEYAGSTRGAPLKANYFREWYYRVAESGLRSANSHVSGDDSHSRLIGIWESIDRANPGAVRGWVMDHCTLINPEDIPRAAKLGMMWSCSPLGEGNRAPTMAAAFGDEIIHKYVAPVKTMLDHGINVSLEGSWSSIESLITRKDDAGKVWGPDQRVDRVTALRIATQNGANNVLKADKLGSIETGKLADLVVIDRDYMSMPEEGISEIRPLLTMMGGRFVFLRTDFANENNLRPAGAVISTYEDLQARRPRSSRD
ncbi:amidohydrolase family protein [Acidobacteria bacterium AH-259-D05]|nr:amidohydrolase family protein [Acidobacteria bacterium AH-259-D05]